LLEAGNVTLAVFKITVTHMQMIMMLTKIGEISSSSLLEDYLRAKVYLLEVFLHIIWPKCLIRLDRELGLYV